MLTIFKKIILFIGLLMLPYFAIAANSTFEIYSAEKVYNAEYGITVIPIYDSEKNITGINVVFNRDVVLANPTNLKEAKTLNNNPNRLAALLLTAPDYMAAALSLPQAPLVVGHVYIFNPTLNKLHFKFFLQSPNNYGQPENHLMYSFDFNAAIANKTDFFTIDFNNLQAIALNYKETAWFQQLPPQ